MKHIKKRISIFIGVNVFIYLLIAFVIIEPNPFNWDIEERIFQAAMSIMAIWGACFPFSD